MKRQYYRVLRLTITHKGYRLMGEPVSSADVKLLGEIGYLFTMRRAAGKEPLHQIH